MSQAVNYLPYASTGYFSKIVTDYLSQSPQLRPFYQHPPTIAGIRQSLEARKAFATPRKLLVEVLNEQYEGLVLPKKVKRNIEALANDNTFTVTTAHQPNIFTGPLYFIYKILHAVKLAEELSAEWPGYTFVPVYYMGSEDADLDELGYVNVGGQKLIWETRQTGAVGRMKVDKGLIKLIHAINGQAGVLPYGKELHELFTQAYAEGKTIQQATLELVNTLFGDYGLVVLIPDNARLKKAFQPVVEKELLEGFSHTIVADTIAQLGQHYKVQAGGREINLFYLLDNKRERIELEGERYEVKASALTFTQTEILQELKQYPERFSANVILRGAFQETVLPNIAFIGGGGELAYWLELKQVFAAVQIPYPVLVLRNSFLFMNKEQALRVEKLGFTYADLFKEEFTLVNTLVKRESENQLDLAKETEDAHAFYSGLKKITDAVDVTLTDHVAALEVQAVKRIKELEKKVLRAERTRYEIQQKQIAAIKQELFPGKSLQERVDNFSLHYAREGKGWIQTVYKLSFGLAPGFGVFAIP